MSVDSLNEPRLAMDTNCFPSSSPVGQPLRERHADQPHALALLRAHRERPRSRAAEVILPMSALPPKADKRETSLIVRFVPKADERTAAKKHRYSITSSALVSSVGGKVRPSILAVWRLMTSRPQFE